MTIKRQKLYRLCSCFGVELKSILSIITTYSLIYSQLLFVVGFRNAVFAADIIPDGSTNTSIDKSQNGTPVINIAPPSSGGVSVNKFQDYNVGEDNLIINNYKGDAVSSNIGGAIQGNPNFDCAGCKGADIILNEITSNRVSKLEGYTEILGKQAELIIANPNGIMVNSAGFLNTSKLTMITGSSSNQTLDSNGNLNPFILSDNPNAIISVVGKNIYDENGKEIVYNLGLDTQDVDYSNLISRVVQINGNIYANKLNIATGNDKAIRESNGEYTILSKPIEVVICNENDENCIPSDIPEKPEFAIDSTALGGIYANKINFIATEDGVGVKTRSDLVANLDDINITSDGKVELYDGNVYASNNIEFNANEVKNSTVVRAGNSVNINADKFDNSDTKNEENALSGISSGSGDIVFNVDELNNNNGNIISGNNLVINNNSKNSDAILNENGMLGANNDIFMDIKGDYLVSGNLSSNDSINIKAENIINNAEMTAENDLIIDAENSIVNYGHITAKNGDLILTTTGTDGGSGISNYGRIALIDNDNILQLNSNSSISNNSGAFIFSNNKIDFNAKDEFYNGSNGLGSGIWALNDINISGFDDANGNALNSNKIVNSSGRIESRNGDIYIDANEFENKRESIGRQEKVQTYYFKKDGKYAIYNYEYRISVPITEESQILSGNNLFINASNVLNDASIMQASNNITINADNLTNNSYQLFEGTERKMLGKDHFYPSGGGACINGWVCWGSQDTWEYHSKLTSITKEYNLNGTISAGNNISITAKQVGNGTVNDFEKDLRKGNKEIVSEDINKINIPSGNNGIFSQNKNPNPSYLFEADPELVDVSKFLGGNYFLSQIGLKQEDIERTFLGDAYVDNKILNEALANVDLSLLNSDKANMSNNYAGNSTPSKDDFINSIYENVSDELVSELGLKFGEALTEEQLEKLDKDIVWYVEKDITLADGTIIENVLVPEIYFSKENRKNLNNNTMYANTQNDRKTGSTISGINIDIKVEGDLTNKNNSSIIASNNIEVSSKDNINNIYGSSINAGGNMTIIAENNINNLGAELFAEYNAKLEAINGGINIETTKERSEKIGGYYDEIMDVAKVGTGSGSLEMTAKNDITIKAGDVNAAGDLSISADNVNIATIELEDYFKEVEKKESLTKSRTVTTEIFSITNKGSSIKSGGNTTITAKNDINVIGSEFDSKEDINLEADNNVNILTALDTHYKSVTKEKDNLVKSSIDVRQNYDLLNRSSDLNADNNINISAKNINMVGTKMSAENGSLYASEDINIVSAEDTRYSYHYNEKTEKDLTQITIGTVATATAVVVGVLSSIGVITAGAAVPAYSTAAALGKATLSVAKDGIKRGEETSTIEQTQVKSVLDFNNLFESYSENNTTVIASDITAKNENSKIETGDLGVVAILSTDNVKREISAKMKYRPSFNVNFSKDFGEETPNLDKKTPNDKTYFEKYEEQHKKEQEKTIIDLVSEGSASIIYNAIAWNDFLSGKVDEEKLSDTIKEKITEQIIENIKKFGNDWASSEQEKEDEEYNKENGIVADATKPKDKYIPPFNIDRLTGFCKDCKLVAGGRDEKIRKNTVKSNIKFGE